MATLEVEWSCRPNGGTVDLESLKRRAWPGIAACAVKIAAPVTYDFRFKSQSNYLILRDFYRVDGETRIGNLPASTTKDLRNKLAFIPAGYEVVGWHKLDRTAAVVFVVLDQDRSTKHAIDLAALPPRIEFEDTMLRSLLLRFQALLDDPSLETPGYVETLAELLTFELARACSCQRLAPASQSGLTPNQVRVVTEYIDKHLSERTAISNLASLLDLSRFHFIRAFKHSTGVPPHQFVIRRRLDRAKELLADDTASIAEIAARTGFGSPVQMTRAFRRVIGTTPSAFRRSEV